MNALSLIKSAFVIGRRDFTATVFSKTFLFFLLGPLFPLALGIMFGGIGAQIEETSIPREVAVIASDEDFEALATARERLAPLAGQNPLATFVHVAEQEDLDAQVDALVAAEDKLLGVLTGGLEAPRFKGAVNADGRTVKQIPVLVEEARQIAAHPMVGGKAVEFDLTDKSASSVAFARGLTARAGQFVLFLLTVLLAGMLLSQLIEEKSNKVIEVLAAAVPVDAIFLGKLFAMLAISIIGIAVWAAAGIAGISYFVEGGVQQLPAPAVGWPLFIILGILYFGMSYLLIGATFLGIGAQASTVREVQTLSMPVTMAQVGLLVFAALGVGRPDSMEAIGAAIFPLSSPFAMIGRAAEVEALWPHAFALIWQALWVALILRIAARLFRRSVLKSGREFRWPWQKKAA